ncbi:hypothetical protein [Epilithonimonas xixisoli]|uniref:Uncharacterized protein n=1 Tax=Epilithonimonas xixisoli TaxID=1476462 RepID=A0A4R8IK35_9FLAO|nr:hypothetical protein [Epilithonimonas xixisoli]TDX87285.1 hypothetical protein B0I22_1473 [Epilithonimonas xixisoli]
MSESILKIIPTNPDYVPATVLQVQAKDFLEKIFTNNNVDFQTLAEVEFVDAGENFEPILCNVCSTEISADEWQDQMDEAFQKQFSDLSFQTSCKHHTSLNDLNYQSSAGFAKFIISVADTQIELSKGEILELEKILKTYLRVIWAFY